METIFYPSLTPLPWRRTSGERHHFLELTLLLTSEAQLLGNSAPRCSVCGHKQREQGEKTFLRYTAATSVDLLFVNTALDYASGRGGDLCASTQLVCVNPALQHWTQFPDINPGVFGRFCSASVGIFSVLPLLYQPNLNSLSSSSLFILQPPLKHGDIQITR